MSRRPPAVAAVLALLALLAPVAAATSVGATDAVGAPSAADGGSNAAVEGPSGPAELQNATRVLTVELVGRTVPGVGLNASARATVAAALGVPEDAVRSRNGTVEVAANRSAERIASALGAAGAAVSADAVERGVTNATRDRALAVLRERVDQATLGDGTTVAPAGDSRLAIRTTAPVDRVRTLLRRGDVEIAATFPTDDGQRTVTLLTNGDFASVGEARQGRAGGPPRVPVTLTDAAAANFTDAMVSFGFTSEAGTENCDHGASPDDPGYCLYTRVDGEVVYAASIAPGLAEIIRSGEFEQDPAFVLATRNLSRARTVALALRTGALPAPARVVEATTVTPTTEGTDEAEDGTTGDAGDGTTSGSGPAPGPVASLAVVVVAALALARRR